MIVMERCTETYKLHGTDQGAKEDAQTANKIKHKQVSLCGNRCTQQSSNMVVKWDVRDPLIICSHPLFCSGKIVLSYQVSGVPQDRVFAFPF